MKSKSYDAVVVGSGFGGALAGYALVKAGLSTLLIERGGWAKRDELDWNQEAILLKQRYRQGAPLLVKQYGDQAFKPVFANEVVGGLSVFYGGASLRLRETDFERWPIGYDDLEPYYSEAERLLVVHGDAGADACEPRRSVGYPQPSQELTAPAQRIFAAAQQLGYHPFKLPLAINFTDSARNTCIKCNTCDGFPCRIEAKNDLTATVLRDAQKLGLEIVAATIVTELEVDGERVKRLTCVSKESKEMFSIGAQLLFLGAGALHSPGLLQRSKLGTEHPFFGRCLMRHCNAVAGYLFKGATNPQNVFHKQLCFTDFYEDFRSEHGTATGVIQDIYTPAPEVLRHFAPGGLKRLAAAAARRWQNLLCIAEDEPRFENRVTLAPEKDEFGLELTRVQHEYSPRDLARRDYLVRKAKRVLRAAGGLIPFTHAIDSFSHAVGTLRFGTEEEESVLDPNCRLRGVDNLFVVDGSFLPTSGGVNPSLTIAANSLRVAEIAASRSV
jgi:choline dehydrogenase-like flavoprotein